MPSTHATDTSSHRGAELGYQQENHIGSLFRNHGEEYIKSYDPSLQRIKLIRAIRLCKTPTLGGKVIGCKDCGHKHYLYYSCGHSHCPICQSIKREQWVDKLRGRLYKVPYVHTTFTLPHQLNGLARANPSIIYNLLMRVSWQTVKELLNVDTVKKVQPGMTSVLHTFGSDMKYHVHVHCLVTFGGYTASDNNWVYPEEKYKIAKYRVISKTFRTLFLKGLKRLYDKDLLVYHENYNEVVSLIVNKRWVVHNTRPTIDTTVLEDYLARYVNRIAISNSRLQYIKSKHEVHVLYNDYRNQISGQAAPKALKIMHPLTAIDQIMQHVLPPYFQKTRHYGIHSSRLGRSLQTIMPNVLLKNGQTVRTLFEILTQLLKQKPYACHQCGSVEYEIFKVTPDKNWIKQFVQIPTGRSPPKVICHVRS